MVPKIDKQGNLIYDQTGLIFTSGLDSTLQTLCNRLRLFRGESTSHPNDGMNYPNLIAYNNPSLITKETNTELKKDKRVIYTHIKTKYLEQGQLSLKVEVKTDYE